MVHVIQKCYKYYAKPLQLQQNSSILPLRMSHTSKNYLISQVAVTVCQYVKLIH